MNSILDSSLHGKAGTGQMSNGLPLWGVTFVTMWDKEHLIENILFVMIQEMMGFGPMKYYINYQILENFFKRLLLLINYLPQKKMCFYPPQVILEPPFDHSP